MPLKQEVVERLRQIVGQNRLMTETEDLYVYSLEKFFEEPKYPRFDAIARTSSHIELKEILRLARAENINVIRRGQDFDKTLRYGLFLDETLPPELERFEEKRRDMNDRIREIRNEMYSGRYGYYANMVSFLTQTLLNKLLPLCKECTTCSGYCTVAPYFNNVETWSAKGRYLLTKGFLKGELKPSKKLVDILYSCSLCGSCYMQCTQELEIDKAFMNARQIIAERGLAPKQMQGVLSNVKKYGSPVQVWGKRDPRNTFLKRLAEGLSRKRGDVLYWVGCNTALRAPQIALATVNVLNKAGVKLTVLDNEGCCGGPIIQAGFVNEAKTNAEKIVDKIKKTGAETLITSCPGCYRTFTDFCPNILDIEVPCKVLHVSQSIEGLLNADSLFEKLEMKATYHDPCELGRHCDIYDPPRKILKAIPKMQLIEMPLNREKSRCCGGGGGLWAFNHNISMHCASTRILQDAMPLNVDAIVTSCPQCYVNFRYASKKQSIDIGIYDVMQLATMALQ